MSKNNQKLIDRLRAAGLRPTRQRQMLGELLLSGPHRHVTAERLHEEAMLAGVSVSLATVYNTLHQFTDAGLLREVSVEGAKTYFDTNVTPHFHFFHEEKGQLIDMPEGAVLINDLPSPPKGTEITDVDVTVRVRSRKPAQNGKKG